MYRSFFKSVIDFVVAFIVLLITSPLTIFTTIALFIMNGGKPFFFQTRPGKNQRLFRIIKFKTMTDKKGANGELLPDKDRLTWIGSIVRKLSIDELPQMINVLKGDMSIVGPRPLLVEYLELYDNVQKRRHDVKPGITGWAQVNGRNTVSWSDKFAYDVWYVDHQSFALDVKILFLTIIKVFKSEGISADGSATVERFTGNKS